MSHADDVKKINAHGEYDQKMQSGNENGEGFQRQA
jgi:hypothetical protein